MPEIAMLTNKTFLMVQKDQSWEEFVPITKYPNTGGEPDKHEVTRLKDGKKRYILGLEDATALVFEANYTKDDYDTVKAAADGTIRKFRLCFGDEQGADGCWEWEGKVAIYVSEGESNGVRKMVITISDEGEEAIKEVTT